MVRSLYTGASGMNAQQMNIDVISNNLANVNTSGFKRARVDFNDLMYQTMRTAGTPSTSNTYYPTATQVGLGTLPTATLRLMEQGSLQNTNNKTDIAIEGDGFFKVRLADGSEGYSRDGSFRIDAQGNLVTANGEFVVEPRIVIPQNYLKDSLTIGQDGLVSVKIPGLDENIPVGQLRLYRFVNPAGLENNGGNVLMETVSSGAAFEGLPGSEGFGSLQQGFLEMSNVNIGRELVNMITAQRAYEFNAKAIQTSDSMLATAVNLKR